MGESKVNPWPIVRAHLQTLVNQPDGRISARDLVVLYGPPVASAGVVAWFDVRFAGNLAVGLLTVAGLAGAFLFQLAVQLVESSSAWADTGPRRNPRTSRQARLFRELMANASYASLVALTAAVALAVVAATKDPLLQRVSTIMAAGLLVHLGLTLTMVLRRVFLFAVDRVDAARTGAARLELLGAKEPDERDLA